MSGTQDHNGADARDDFGDGSSDNFSPGEMRLLPIFGGDLFLRVVPYPVIVERYDKVVGKSVPSRNKRRYQATFTDVERQIIGRWHAKFYRWYLVSGTPQKVAVKPSTLQLLQRAVAFFASV